MSDREHASMSAACSCIRCGYPIPAVPAPAEDRCAECGLPAETSRDPWRRHGGEAGTLALVARRGAPAAVLASFLALGWSSLWIVELWQPSITLPGIAGRVSLTETLSLPFELASWLAACLWLRLVCMPSPWDASPTRWWLRLIASAWCVAATVALVVIVARSWAEGVIERLFGPAHLRGAMVAVWIMAIPILPFGAGFAALRVAPPARLTAWRERTRWLRRGAFIQIAASAAFGVAFVGAVWWMGRATPGARAYAVTEFLFLVASIIAMAITPIGLVIIALSLLALTARAAAMGANAGLRTGGVLRSGARTASVGGIVIAAVMTVATLFAVDRLSIHAPASTEHSLANAAIVFFHLASPAAWLTLLGFTVAIVAFWIIAAMAPAVVARRARGRAAGPTASAP